ncbi:MAG: hypothetical protein KAJ07_04970 [Planctomycetes bacterium]|nr:hypothetical protein [Planctomycetota bacterium]
MSTEPKSERYEQILALAEGGKYQEALASIDDYLKDNPRDGQGWNDSGAILFCLGKVDEGVSRFEKARDLCGDSAEIIWNLCEAYIDGGYPSMAVGLFDTMKKMDIFSCDILNRTATVFVNQGYCGSAIEMMLESLEISPSQEILHPMIEVVRSKRPKITLFGSKVGCVDKVTHEFLEKRFLLDDQAGKSAMEIESLLQFCDIAWFEGVDETLIAATNSKRSCKLIVRANVDDIYGERLARVNFANVDMLIVKGTDAVKEAVIARLGDSMKSVRVVFTGYGVSTDEFKFSFRSKGKRLACIGDIDAESNPMLLLQCMQKLNYIDGDYRLYVAGKFEDNSIERYTKYMVDQMGLSSVVFFDGNVENLNSWLKDKHYIVSAGTSERCIDGVLSGVSCGLRPVVHNFPGAADLFDTQYTFNIAEDLCEQVANGDYDPQSYRDIAEANFCQRLVLNTINEGIGQVERDMEIERRVMEKSFAGEAAVLSNNAPAQINNVNQTLSDFSLPPISSIPGASEINTIEIKPIMPTNIDKIGVGISLPDVGEVAIPSMPQETVSFEISKAAEAGTKSIDSVAAEALKASRLLADLSKQETIDPRGQQWNTDIPGQMSFGSLDEAIKGNQLNEMAQEFTDQTNKVRIKPVNTFEEQQVPFGT